MKMTQKLIVLAGLVLWSNGLVVSTMNSQSKGPGYETSVWLQGWSFWGFHPSKIDQMSASNFWGLIW